MSDTTDLRDPAGDPGEPPSPYLAQHIRDAMASGSTAELGIDVTVTPAGVHLSGIVASEAHRDELGAVAAREAGGRPIRNDLTVVHGTPDTDVEVLG
jgi:hypothetical protein